MMGFSAYTVADACVKWLSTYYPIIEIVALTYCFSLIFCMIVSPWLGGLKRTVQTKRLKIHIARGFTNIGVAVCAILALSHMPITSAYTIFFMAPFIVTLLALPLYKEHVPWQNWLVIALGFTGVLIAFPPGPALFDPWVLAAFGTTLCVAALNLLARPLGPDETILSLSFYPNIINVLCLGPLALLVFVAPSPQHLLIFALTGVMLTLGLIGVASGFRLARHAVAAPVHYIQIVWGSLIGYFIFGDVPSWQMLLGAGIIILSGFYLIETERRNGHNKLKK
ncbi:MAG: DMT family transporter [Rhodospirillales bacterium]|nr:DMT family transporter [Alphaproteobacteria bacterium]MCB9981982.1 DMT family transporter [Rhodospirillales bacterium]